MIVVVVVVVVVVAVALVEFFLSLDVFRTKLGLAVFARSR